MNHHIIATDEPPFWDHTLHLVPWAQDVLAKAADIREEILNFIPQFRPFMPYPKYANLYNNTWDAFPLSVFQGEHIEMSKEQLAINIAPLVAMFRSKLPVSSSTIEPLEGEGHLRNVFVSRLIPDSIINPHRGWTPDYMRIHLCLVEDPDCHITVGTITRTWQTDRFLAFKDGGPHLHSVVHKGQHERIILSYDLSLNYLKQFIPQLR